MASGSDKKVVRCTYSELKILAEQLEGKQNKSRGTSAKTSRESSKPDRTDLRSKNEVRRSRSEQNKTVKNKDGCRTSDQTVKKSLNSTGLLHMDLGSVQRKSGGVDNEQENSKMSKKVEHSSRNGEKRNSERFNEDFESNDEYNRENVPSRSNKALYDPVTNRKQVKSTNISEVDMLRNRSKRNANKIEEISDKIDNLEISGKSDELSRKDDLKRMQRKKAETLFAECGYLERNINKLLSRRITSEKQLNDILNISDKIQEQCKQIMLTDLSYFTTKEAHHKLWRNCIYPVIERVRGLQRESQEYDDTEDDSMTQISLILQKYLDSVDAFINDMIQSLEKKSEFLLQSFLENAAMCDNSNRQVKMALLCCHHFMIFLGDIERYKQSLSSVKEWSKARSYYLKASKVAPKNGKPYNQLAVIAVYAKRRLDAVYYYVRSLTVSNPIMTAREKLHAIFDDVQRKAYELHKNHQEIESGSPGRKRKTGKHNKHVDTRGRSRNGPVNNKKTTSEGRHELWVFFRGGVRHEFLFTPDGLIIHENHHQEENEKHHTKISLNEINKQFDIFYLCSHAMLYTKIGIDHFSENHRKVLRLFKTLLKHPACSAVSAKRLIEIMAINMFEIANTTNDDSGQFIEGTPLDLALTLGIDMFECLCEASLETSPRHPDSNNKNLLDDDFQHVILVNALPALKVWFDWMKDNITLLRTSSVSVNEEFWACVSDLLNNLIHVYALEDLPDVAEGDDVIALTEDDQLEGFKLLAHASKPRANVAEKSHKGIVCKKLRIETIHTVARFLCEFEDLPLRFDENTQHYYVTKVAVNCAELNGGHDVQSVDEIDEEDIEDDVIVESVEDFDSDAEVTSPVRELKAKRDALTKEIQSHKRREEDTKAVLVEHSSKPTLVLEINPQYLVPDTNCFIDYLNELQRIVESKIFTFVIPLVVINELDGLAKGVLDTEIGEAEVARLEYVAARSREAIDFLEYCFSLGDSQMLALTSKGSVLTTIAFRSEEPVKGRVINDDVILSCCHHYCDANMDVVNKLASPDQPFTIRRKVVLVTEDRNLRLKAHVQNIPVVTVPQFLEMITP